MAAPVGNVARQDADLECQRAQHLRTVDRSALGQQIDDTQIDEREYSAEDERDDDDRQDHWQDDLVVASPEPGAVDRRRIEHVLRQVIGT